MRTEVPRILSEQPTVMERVVHAGDDEPRLGPVLATLRVEEVRGATRPWRVAEPEPTLEQRLAAIEQRLAELEEKA